MNAARAPIRKNLTVNLYLSFVLYPGFAGSMKLLHNPENPGIMESRQKNPVNVWILSGNPLSVQYIPVQKKAVKKLCR